MYAFGSARFCVECVSGDSTLCTKYVIVRLNVDRTDLGIRSLTCGVHHFQFVVLIIAGACVCACICSIASLTDDRACVKFGDSNTTDTRKCILFRVLILRLFTFPSRQSSQDTVRQAERFLLPRLVRETEQFSFYAFCCFCSKFKVCGAVDGDDTIAPRFPVDRQSNASAGTVFYDFPAQHTINKRR